MEADLDLNSNDLLNASLVDTVRLDADTIYLDGVSLSGILAGEAEALSSAINVKSYGAVADGTTDDTDAIQAAIDYAASQTYPPPVYIPAGQYLVNTTIVVSKEGQVIFGDGMKSSVLKPGMTDGTPVIRFSGGPDFWEIRDLGIIANVNAANYAAGSVNGQNCKGIEAYATSDPYTARFSMSNVYCYGLNTGFNISGFIATLTNLYAQFCDLGFYGLTINSTWANLRLEGCRKSFAISDADGLHLAQLLDEGAVANALSATLDDCKGVTFTNPYWEGASTQARAVPFLTIGGTTECRSVSIQNARIVGSGGMAANTYPIKIDRVDGCRVSCTIADGTGKHGIETTSNTKNLTEYQQYREFGVTQDASKQVSAPVNYFPNSHFDVWFRGWDTVGAVRATAAQETTLVRRGPNALKVSATAGQNFNYVGFTQTNIATFLRGKTVRMGAWIWVPNITEYTEDAWTAFPAIVLNSQNGSVTVSSSSVNQKMINNAWNYLTCEVTVQADATSLELFCYANQSSTNASGNEFIVVDSITLCESTVPFDLQMYGALRDSPQITQFTGGRMIYISDTQPNDADQTYGTGDLVFKAAPAANTSPGWFCSTGGVGGVAVFSNFPDTFSTVVSASDSAIVRMAGTTGKQIKDSVVTINSTGIISGASFLSSALQIKDPDQSHNLAIAIDNLTANRTLTINSNDVGRTITLTGNPTLNQDVSTAGSPTFSSARATGTGGVGYATGAGGTVTQLTDKSTGVTLNKTCGQITMNSASLAANTSVTFTLTNSTIAAGDILVLNHISGGTAGAYSLNAQSAAGSASINVRNLTAGALGEAIVIAFAVIKAVTA